MSTDLERLVVKERIQELVYLYAHAADRRRWDLMEHVFHDDAWVGMTAAQGLWRDWVDEVAQIFDAHLGETSHLNANLLIDLDGKVAHTESYCVAYHRVRADAPEVGLFRGTGEEYELIGGLRYLDRFECRDGRWAIAERRVQSDWRHIRPLAEGNLGQTPPEFRGSVNDEVASRDVVRRWLS